LNLPSAAASLPLMEDFYTLQGEGAHQGNAAYFIRLAGCHVKCVWCDVKESWDINSHPIVSIASIVEKAKSSGSQIAVITGGEPTMHDLLPLTTSLKEAGLRTHIETSGAYNLTGMWDWVCFSPKKFMTPVEGFARHAHELKVVVFHKSDFEWAEKYAAQTHSGCQLFLQPEWSKEKEILPAIIDYVKKNPRWRISLQVHKYMNIP
jgi:7-carboxy-7-deazaguanine synthase